MLDAIAEFGVLLLLLLTGMDAAAKPIRTVGRPALAISATGVLIPFACGVSLGFMLPPEFLPEPSRRTSGASPGPSRAFALFLAASLTFGCRFVSIAIRLVHDSFASKFPVVTLILVITCGLALVTEAFGVQTVLGAFVAGVLIGESPILTKHISNQLRGMVASFFAPVFFVLAGLNSDLTILGSPRIALLAAGLILVASVGKFAGAFIGCAIGRRSRAEALALAIGMNARGSTEVIVASIGLSIGAFAGTSTTCAMPPTFRWALARTPMRPGAVGRGAERI